MSDTIEFPANQSEVQKNWETTMIGKINLIKRMSLIIATKVSGLEEVRVLNRFLPNS